GVGGLCGYPRAELLGRMIEILVPERYAAVHPHRDNAIKFTGQGRVRLEFGRRLTNGQSATEISIIDTGAGIRPEEARGMTTKLHALLCCGGVPLAWASSAMFVLMLLAGDASGQTPATVPRPSDLKKLS